MSAFVDSVKQIFSSVFGHADIDHLLTDEFEMDPSMKPSEGPHALHRRAAAQPPPPRVRAPSPPPARLRAPPGAERDTFGEANSLEIPELDDFAWSDEFALGSASSQDPTGEAPAPPHAPPTLRLRRHASPGDDEAFVPPQSVVESGVAPPTRETADLLLDLAAVDWEAPPPPLVLQRSPWGPPPGSIWDEAGLRLDLLEQLDRERGSAPPGFSPAAWASAADRVMRVLGQGDAPLPALPSAARQLLARGSAPPSDEEIVEALRVDPALAGRIIKAANSPFYMAACPAASLQGALVRIGLQEARRLALAAAFDDAFGAPEEASAMVARRHALATAVAAEILARSAKVVDSGSAFLAGLLHDAGALLTHRVLRDDPTRPAALIDAFAQRIHQRVGGLFFAAWDLDASVASALCWHHDPGAVEVRFAPICHVVHVADLFADLAMLHAESPAWQGARPLYLDRDDPQGRARAPGLDGVDDLDLAQILGAVPAGFGLARARGVLRGLMLRLEQGGS